MAEQQNYSNHAKFFPPFHFFAAPILIANFIWAIIRLKPLGFSPYAIFSVVVAAALVVTLTIARVMALKVQDRVIRLEERLRYERLLPADLNLASTTSRSTSSSHFASPATPNSPRSREKSSTTKSMTAKRSSR